LAQQTDDIDLKFAALDTEQAIAYECQDPYWALKVVHKAREIPGFISTALQEYTWINGEAWAHFRIGNLSRALDLSARAEELLTLAGMEGSDRYLGILDIRADIYSHKSEYLEARQLYAQIVKTTSPTCSPAYHAHALCGIAEMDILMEGEVAGIISNLNAAETVYMALGSSRILLYSWSAAELKLYSGDTENARAAFLECLSKSRGIYADITQFCLAALADRAHKMHGVMDTFRWAVVHLAFVYKAKDPVGTLQALRRLADLYMTLDDSATALHIFHVVLEEGTKMDIHRLRAECMARIGEIMLRRGDPMQAKEMWEAAHPLFVRSSQMKYAALVEKRLEKLSRTGQDNSHSLPAIWDEATTSATVVFKAPTAI
jgi:tetratricopeptide (TPR) repeat protein